MELHPLWDDYPTIQKELQATLSLIEDTITIRNEDVRDKINEMLTSGGKLLRPAYSLLFSLFSENRNPEKARAIAAAIEVLHMATLVHDDVIDGSDKRRNRDTLNVTYGNRVAIYTGDYLFTVAFRLLQEYASDINLIENNSEGIEKILIGELQQMDRRYNTNMRMRDYLSQIQGKTAYLFGLSCYSGAYEVDPDSRFSRQAFQIGSNIGMAFQIMDDILDFTADDTKVGKPIFQDIKNGIYTAPVLYTLKKEPKKILPFLEKGKSITDKELQALYALVIDSGGLNEAKNLADKYTRKALKQISKLPNRDAKKLLLKITEQITHRNF
ncbi:Heptaprenyl diphosphate synthase component 2 [Jeotgalibaca dankookensis]|uniref:Heptaprenyl diphosphate synthase component 2 n=1 Tax=Jeotgalibaca dankookensis TaxID=708126 RepID=A0A1S6IRG8_9LACT|nr:polyprenyl synthetase family protein [Jeotgalibaca dankookensis]AQS54119.1 Heptaprenyl diphosphate synthase component 2 [Jeotgalibaca dankookensis]